jgi:solute carrier family 25 citrate transporter 1
MYLFRQMLRQGANSAVRFTTYSTLKQLVQGNGPPGQPLPGGVTFGIGAIAGIVTVCTSDPSSLHLSNCSYRVGSGHREYV